MTPELEDKIEAFIAERDEMLLANDIDRMIEFHKKHNPYRPNFANREVAEIALHKARTGAKSLPVEERKKSKAWLTDRGYQSMDDGDLK
jgi:hypothetical protein